MAIIYLNKEFKDCTPSVFVLFETWAYICVVSMDACPDNLDIVMSCVSILI